jgi:hypothetical protein
MEGLPIRKYIYVTTGSFLVLSQIAQNMKIKIGSVFGKDFIGTPFFFCFLLD